MPITTSSGGATPKGTGGEQARYLRPFKYRQIITHGYVMGGYKDSVPWRNVNVIQHSTDVCTNLGDLLAQASNYTSGCCNRYNGFMWSAGGGQTDQVATTASFSMATHTSRGLNANWNTLSARLMAATAQKEDEMAYVLGTVSSYVDTFNLYTETMISNTGPAFNTNPGSSFNDETFAVHWDDATTFKLTFATSTPQISNYTIGSGYAAASVHSQQKGISSKNRRGWAGNEGTYNGGYNLRSYNTTTMTKERTVAKPIGNCGEENFDMGQDHQYCLGNYDGAQNNRGWKFTYATEAGYELGAGSVRTGVPGGSSGHCTWKG